MILTDTGTNTTITLPDDLIWENEHAWTPTTGRADYALSGSIVIQQSARRNGRPIVLASPDANRGVIHKSVLEELQSLVDSTPTALTLDMLGRQTKNVIFDYTNTPLESKPVYFVDNPTATDLYFVTIRLIQV